MWTWDSIPYSFPAGQSTYLQDYLAEHFATHLVDRELNKLKLPTDAPKRAELLAKCFGTVSAPAADATQLETQIMNEPEEKVKAKPKAKKVEEEFEGLKK